jgi:hypothetical protein
MFDDNHEPIVRYNCAAFAVGIYNTCSTRIETLPEAHAYLTSNGFRRANLDFSVNPRLEKVAVYAIAHNGFPDNVQVTHFARQQLDGTWISKFGPGPLIRHRDLGVLAGETGENSYGSVYQVYVRDRRPPACNGSALVATLGDWNANERLDVGDLNLLSQAVVTMTPDAQFDIDDNGQLDRNDVTTWLQMAGTTNVGRAFTFGDVNLDGTFDSSDLVEVFTFGGYEDQISGNANWSSGDWDGDGEFSTSDLVLAFSTGAYRS